MIYHRYFSGYGEVITMGKPDYPNANFTPTMLGYTGQGAFRYWCQTALPLVYDDSLSYYELLNKVVNYLNNVISDVSNAETNIDALLTAYEELQGYVNTYFTNIDIQDEINAKLDEMASNGTLSEIIEPFIPDIITTWLNEHVTPTSPIVDNTLTISGAAADSKTTGDRLSEVFSAKPYLSGTITLSDYRISGWYGIAGGATITDKPDGAGDAGGLTLFVYNSTNASGSYIYQVLMQGNGRTWNRVINKSSGSTALDWVSNFNYQQNIDGTVTLSDLSTTGWYSFSGSATFTDAPFNVGGDSGVSLFVFEDVYASGSYTLQIFVCANDNRIFKRHISGSGVVSGWKTDFNCIGNLSGNVTLSTIVAPGWYSFSGSTTFTDPPYSLNGNYGVSLVVYNRTAASGSFTTQFLIAATENAIYYRHISSSGSASDWICDFKYRRNLTGTVNLSTILIPGWYSTAGSTTFTDAPDNVTGANGVTLFVYEKTHASAGYTIQFLIAGTINGLYYRHIHNGTASTWSKFLIKADMLEFLKPVQTISNSETPLSSYRETGWYGLTGSYNPSDIPPGANLNQGSTLFVYDRTAASSDYILQIYIQGRDMRMWARTISRSGGEISGFTWQEIGFARAIPVIGKTIMWYGDSIVSGQGGNGVSFPNVANAILSLKGVNPSVSGRSVSTIRTTPTPMVTAFETEITEKDVLYFQGGTNDFWSSAPMRVMKRPHIPRLIRSMWRLLIRVSSLWLTAIPVGWDSI